VDQGRSELAFQGTDLLAQRRLGEVQPLRRTGELQLLGHSQERP
jgi:hypothetical protein